MTVSGSSNLYNQDGNLLLFSWTSWESLLMKWSREGDRNLHIVHCCCQCGLYSCDHLADTPESHHQLCTTTAWHDTINRHHHVYYKLNLPLANVGCMDGNEMCRCTFYPFNRLSSCTHTDLINWNWPASQCTI